ncbi:protein mono-ADP-ribosyltransferase PARP15-like [Gymnodraco acuticeps]|uniref:Protein mono-ADP-ribosyltransferase PARP15-like n=1 Tax=Gymnodraco acuticeps TaxID=8218 RepID=A0A6P8VIH9_GYMAC|nr:protein mono-ADP-ribosyltransferase PARP15-like [Gymnodraco acuticeps]
MSPGKRKFGALCWNCYPRDPTTDKREKMDGWMDVFGIVGNVISIALSVQTHRNIDIKVDFYFSFILSNFLRGRNILVNANYSAQPTYSKPADDGSQLMFVVRVLTGLYTQGQENMRVPPPVSDQEGHDRYDSVVDRVDNPQMYVVFHDNQAYPDYLITFK